MFSRCKNEKYTTRIYFKTKPKIHSYQYNIWSMYAKYTRLNTRINFKLKFRATNNKKKKRKKS